ncbi:unnamed protein product [Gulo gulo]|uniref:Uncharacterized protein n=1 Tax=Gulo gulo TaxID=48420 RepID=A0A9X9MCT6_GULGU|nr:unnamed protein product [Gulo gulo]
MLVSGHHVTHGQAPAATQGSLPSGRSLPGRKHQECPEEDGRWRVSGTT